MAKPCDAADHLQSALSAHIGRNLKTTETDKVRSLPIQRVVKVVFVRHAAR